MSSTFGSGTTRSQETTPDSFDGMSATEKAFEM